MNQVQILTVAIPTHNRAPALRESLERMLSLSIPGDVDWELLIVQNACNDATPDVVAEFAQRLPVRCIPEPRAGVSNARNTAAASARGQYIIFTDDDTFVDPEWVAAYRSAFDAHPNADVFGGPIVPLFMAAPPAWLELVFSEVASAYGHRAADTPNAELGMRLIPYGANMAFRTSVLRKQSFNPAYGPIGTKRINGSETDLIRRLLGDGHVGRWVKAASVEHRIQPSQMTRRFLRWYYAGHGAELASRPISSGQPSMLFGRPRWMWRTVITAEMRYHCRRLYAHPDVWIRDLKAASIARGQLRPRPTFL